jgi:hypothetical protein
MMPPSENTFGKRDSMIGMNNIGGKRKKAK